MNLIRAEQIICHKVEHLHNSPIQNMVTIEINGHIVDITQDGHLYNARIDGDLMRCDLTDQQLTQFIKDNT